MTTTTGYADCDAGELKRLLVAVQDQRPRMLILLALGERLVHIDTDVAIAALKEAHELGRTVGDDRERLDISLALAHCALKRHDIAEISRFSAEAERLLDRLPEDDRAARSKLRYFVGRVLLWQCDYSRALPMLDEALTIARAIGSGENMVRPLICIGEIRFHFGNLPTALEHFNEAMTLCEEGELWHELPYCLFHMAQVQQCVGDGRRALASLRRGIEICERLGDHTAMGMMLSEMGVYYIGTDEYALALEHYQRALVHFRKVGHGRYEAFSSLAVGVCLSGLGDYVGAIGQLEAARAIFVEMDDRHGEADALTYLAEAHAYRGEIALALDLVRGAARIGVQLGSYLIECRAYSLMSDLYEQAGAYREALECCRHLLRLKDIIAGPSVCTSVEKIQSEADMKRTVEENHCFAGRIARLEAEIDRQRRELASMALHLAQKREAVDRIKKGVLPLSQAGSIEGAELARRVLREIDADAVGESEWRAFDRRFREVHPTFIAELTSRCPSLTRTELKICILLRLDLATKEIANLASLSAHTVDTHRRRIRKKLGLDEGQSLTSYLLPMGGEADAAIVA